MNRLIVAYVVDISACPQRQAVFYLREAMSHARTKIATADVSSLTIGWRHFRTYTANAATSSWSASESEMAAWRIANYEENRIMKKTYKDYGFESLLPSGEPALGINRKREIK